MKRMLLLWGCIFALGLLSCGSDDNDDDDNISILVNGAETVAAVETGQSVLLRLSNGVPAAWSVSDTSVATLSAASGVSVHLAAQAAGSVTVTATAGGRHYTRALQITAQSSDPNGGTANAPNVTFINLSAYKVVVCRDGLSAALATVAPGATNSVYVAPGTTEITFHFRYSYCVLDDTDSGMVWLDVSDSTAYTYPVDSADIAQGAVQVRIPAPKNPQFNAAYLKVANQSDAPISLYNGNTQQKVYGQEKYYIQPGHSGVYAIPPNAPFDGFRLGENPASATPVAPFYAVSGVVYACIFSVDGSLTAVNEELRLGEAQTEKTFAVTFEANGGTVSYPIEAKLLEESDMPKPTRQGYLFAGWYIDIDLQSAVTYPYVVSKNTTLYAKWTENTDTIYTVRHFNQNIDRTSYTLAKTETLTGTTGTVSAAVAMTYIGFTAESFEQVPISADGTSVIDIYYDRNAYTVTFDANNGTGNTQTQTFYYGIKEKLKDTMFSNPGYTFLGWATSKTDNPIYNNKADFLIDSQNPTDITLYAVWLCGIIVTADTIESIDLSGITDTYTIKMVGNISQNTLQTLADKIKTAKTTINLDLSEATELVAIGATSDSKSIFADCPLNEVVLPKTLEVIGSYAFAQCSIKYVTIPASVQTIGNNAFSYCSNLESVEIDGIETIGEYAFTNCKSLKTVALKNINNIGKSAFCDCENISSVTIKSVGFIRREVFYNCSTLELLEIDGAKSIELDVFKNSKNLKTIVLKNISNNNTAFYDCAKLSSVTIESVDSIRYDAFQDCINLRSVILKNVAVIYGGQYNFLGAFSNCKNLSSVTMEAVGQIDAYAFSKCSSLSSITIDAESIDYCAFIYCTALTAVTVGKNVKSIGTNCFIDCKLLTSVRFEDTENWYCNGYITDVTDAAANARQFKFGNNDLYKE